MSHTMGRPHRMRRTAVAVGMGLLLPFTAAACAGDEPADDEIIEEPLEEPLEEDE